MKLAALFPTACLILFSSVAGGQRGMSGYVPQVNEGERDLAEHRYISAASHFRYALVWDRSGVSAHVGLGNVYLKLGLRERALQQFAAVLQNHRHVDAAERGIHSARSEGEEQQAFQDLEDEVARNPHDPDLETSYAEELIERGRLEEATTEANRSLTQDPKQWHAHCALGRIAFAEGHLDEAKAQLTLAVDHDSDDDDAIETLGDIEMSTHHPDAAAKLFRRLIAILPEEAEGHEKLAAALEKLGDHEGAEQQLKISGQIRQSAKDAGK